MNKKLLLLFILLTSAMGLRAQVGAVKFTDGRDGTITLKQGATDGNGNYTYGVNNGGNYYNLNWGSGIGDPDQWRLQHGTTDPDYSSPSTYTNDWVIEVNDGLGWVVIFFNTTTSSHAPPTSGWQVAPGPPGAADNISNFTLINITLSPTTLASATVGAAFSQTITASGSSGSYTYSVTSGSLPAGLSLSSGGVLSGTPTVSGSFNFTITAKDGSAAPGPYTGSQTYTLTVNPPTITLSPSALSVAVVGTSYSQTVTASGGSGSYTYTEVGTLPTGISLSSAGILSGTTNFSGSYPITITARDGSPAPGPYTGSQTYTLQVNAPIITLSPSTLPTGTAEIPYSQTITASGGTGPYTYSETSLAWPSGLTLNSSTGVLSGTPTVGGNFTFTITATDSFGNTGSKVYTLSLNTPTITLSPTTLPNATFGSAYSQTFSASGGTAPYTYLVTTGSLPAGLSLSSAGVLSGTPTVSGSFPITIMAFDSFLGVGTGFTGSQSYVLTVNGPTITLSPATLPNATVATSYSQTITASGGTGPYTYAPSLSFPAFLTLNSSTGVLSGTPTVSGTFNFSIAAYDANSYSSGLSYTLTVNAPPTITTDAGSSSFVAGDNVASTPVVVDAGISVTDGASTTLASVTIGITGNFLAGEDILAFTNNGTTMGNITASYNATTGVLTLTSSGATATLAQWQSALQSITYTNTAVAPNNATRTISFTAVDGASNTSNTATRTITVTDNDQTPIVTTTGGTTNYVPGTSAATIDGGITVTDRDNTTQASGSVTITSGFHSGDTFTFVNTSSTTYGNIVGSYNATTGVLTLTSSGATASDVQWSHALSAVTFSAGSSATPGNRTVSFTVNDGTKNSMAATDMVAVLGPPTITTDAGSAAFTAGDNVASTPVAIDAGITVTDGIAPTLASATVAITGNFHSDEDVLAFTNTGSTIFGNIAGSYNAPTGVLTLTSAGTSATLTQWQSALQSVTYTNTAITPNNATRTISFAAVDNSATTSNTATRTVTVADVDQTPIVTTTGGTTNYVGGTSAVTIDGGITVSDLDNTTQASGTVSITSGFHSGDTETFINTNSTTFGNIVSSYNAATGVLTLTSSGATASDVQWSHALSAVTFSAGSSAAPGNRTISFAVSDGTKTSAVATDQVNVSLSNDATLNSLTSDLGILTPAFTPGTTNYTVGVPYVPSMGMTVTTTQSNATVSVTAATHFAGGNYPQYLIGLSPGDNTIVTIVVTAQDGVTQKTYTLTMVPLRITTGPLPNATVETIYSQNITALGGTAPYTYSVTAGVLPAGLTLTSDGTFSGNPISSGVFNFTITATDSSPSSPNSSQAPYTSSQAFTLTVDKATPTITFNPLPAKTYGDADFDPGATSTNTATPVTYTSSNTAAATIISGKIHIVGAGTTTITASQAADANYNSAANISQTLTVNPVALTVTANVQNKIYGGADPSLSYTFSPALIAGDSFTGSLSRAPGESVGTYAINQGSLALNNNYNLTYTGNNLTINPAAITVTANAQSKTYGQTDPTLTYTFSPALVTGDSFTGSLSRAAGETVGSYAINQGSLALNNNYNLTYTGANLTIGQATLTITADDQTRVYGAANPVLTAHYNGFINGDDVSKLTTAPSLATTATATSAAGNYTITASGAAIPNYTIAYLPGTLTITKAPLTVTANNQSRNYGAANPLLSLSYNGFVNGDDASKLSTAPTASTTAGVNTAPGAYPITASGGASPNYIFAYVPGTLTIVPLKDDSLSSLTVNNGRVSLSPDFSSGVYTYSSTVENQVGNINITPQFGPGATAQVNGNALSNNSSSRDIPLQVGNNAITITITAQDGSQHTYTMNIYRGMPASSITATNILTPNGDGKNDTWLIKDINLYPDNIVSVYDRAGRLVYSKRGYQNDWEGTAQNGSPLSQGTYYFTVYLGNDITTIKGFITIIRE